MLRNNPIALAMGMAWGIAPLAVLSAEPVDTKTVVVAPAATPGKETVLAPVKVIDDRDREAKGYQGDKTRVGKVPQLAKDIPQSITSVSEQLMRERNADTFKEALRNVAGLTFNAGEGGRIGDNITLRGYSAVGDLYLDGIRDIAQYNRETFNLEQIDILRGSAAMLFGRGSAGGIINQISKTAKPVDRNEIAVVIGTDNYKRVTADLNKAITPDLAFRLNAMKTETDSFRDGVSQDRWGIAPSLSWGSGTADEITLGYYYTKDDNVPDYGVPYLGSDPLNVPINTFYGLSNADYERTKTSIGTATYTHTFDGDTALRTTLRRADYDRDLRATAPRLGIANAVTGACTIGGITTVNSNTAVCRQRQARGGEEHTYTAQADFNTTLETGSISHALLVGGEYLHEEANRWTNTSALANPYTVVGISNQISPLPANFDSSFSRTAPNSYTGRSFGFYGQDTIEFIPHWKLLLGVRYDNLQADYERSAGGPLSRRDKVWSYRSGLLFQPTKYVTYYASYSTAYNPSAEAYQLDDRSTNTPPEKNRNLEFGAKWELAGGDLSLRTALFRTEKTNERNTDLAVPDAFLLSGKRHTDGVELEAVGRLSSKWELFANTAFMRANIDEAAGTSAGNKGKVPVNTPNYTYSIWSTYSLGEMLGGRWKVGGGIEAVSRRYSNPANTISLAAYERVDAIISYDTKSYGLKLNIFNLFDKKYYEGLYTGHTVPGTPRAAQLTATVKF